MNAVSAPLSASPRRARRAASPNRRSAKARTPASAPTIAVRPSSRYADADIVIRVPLHPDSSTLALVRARGSGRSVVAAGL